MTVPPPTKSADPGAAPERNPALLYAVAGISALGGLLFGYDTGIISSALLDLSRDLDLSSRQQEVVVSAILVGAMIGAPVSGTLTARHGRRPVVIGVAVVFAAGSLIAAVAPGVGSLVAARVVLGLAVGAAANTVPVYIAETAPAAVRGRLMVLFQLMVATGQLLSYLVGYALAGPGGWRWMFALAAIPAAALALGMLPLPESPRWLVGQGHPKRASDILTRLRKPGSDIESELADIDAVRSHERGAGWGALRGRWVRPALVVALGIAAFSQLTGINAMVYYAPTLLSDAGFGDSTALLTGVGIGVMLVLAGIAGALLVDRTGRRRLLLVLLPGSGLAMAVLGLGFLAADGSAGQRWTVILGLFAYIFLNGASMQAVVWLLAPEVLPLAVRGPGVSLATTAVWGFDLLIALTALTAVETFGRTATFLFYALMNAACWVFVLRRVPETRGRSLEQIEQALRRRTAPRADRAG
ncbi:sugar porter family MFS transporter [Streptomyces tubbatahanensis]|uniref:Sugar porter family MFS transporter n=1 Tax=Streptomyces tubbatahanensis TaxID=2923272 RepID=A0ABY3XM99_9ACTN|nr:sugar porter family MFS transporter [Streptomyces tubbatahanensis]UNS95557.1 sugar porter family MFS transporter [Streptomyces tubbatahanensis]